MTEEQLHILQHSLGVDRFGRGEQYRNHFVTGPESVDHPHCMALVEAGFMTIRTGIGVFHGMDLFHVTEAGKAAMLENSPPSPKLTRSQRRYRQYLDADCGLTFREWLNRSSAA